MPDSSLRGMRTISLLLSKICFLSDRRIESAGSQNYPIGHAETAQLDVEIMHPGSRDQCRQYLDELSRLAVSQAGRLTDLYIGDYLCLARCHLNEAGLQAFLNVDYILEIDRKPRPTFDTALLYQTTLGDLGIIPEAPEDASGILVIDSGVMGNHPLLRPALGEAEVFPDRVEAASSRRP